jgi:hypothetical protein
MTTPHERDLRKDKRRALGVGGSSRVHLVIEGETISAKTVDLSPGGIGIVTKELRQSRLPRVASRVEIFYRKGTQRELVVPAVVRNVNFNLLGDHVLVRIGLSFGHDDEDQTDPEAKGQGGDRNLIECPDFFRPSAFCADPLFFQERLHFLVSAVTPRSLQLVSSARNKSIFRGVELPLTVFLPMLGTFEVKVVVGKVMPASGPNRYVFHANFLGESRLFLEALSRYLILSGAAGSLSRLVEMGFPVRDVETLLHFRVASGPAEIAAAEGFRKTLPSARASGASSVLDVFAKATPLSAPLGQQVLCFLGGELLGVGHIHFVKGKGAPPSALEQHFCRLPTELREAGFVESSFLSTKETAHLPDAFVHFIKQFARLTMESGLTRLVTTCRREVWPVYRALGFVSVPVEFHSNAQAEATEAVVAVLDVVGILRGTLAVDKKVWTRVYEPVANHMGLFTSIEYSLAKKGKAS